MKSITQLFTAAVLFSMASCASSKGEVWVVTQARGNHFQNQHTKRWYKLEKGNEAHVGDSLLVVFNSKNRFVKLDGQTSQTALNNAVTKNGH